MLGRLWSRDRDDAGFTLIELLVVIIIIGILAAIAIPVFLSQRQKAADASAKSDIRNVATAIETWAVDNPSNGYTGITQAGMAQYNVHVSKGDSVTLLQHNQYGYCLVASNVNGSPNTGPLAQYGIKQVIWWWDSQSGGLIPQSQSQSYIQCPKTTGYTSDNPIIQWSNP